MSGSVALCRNGETYLEKAKRREDNGLVEVAISQRVYHKRQGSSKDGYRPSGRYAKKTKMRFIGIVLES